MATLAQLLAAHGSILVLDAASATVQTGLLRAGSPAIWKTSPDEAGTALFSCAEACLRDAGLGLDAVGAFAYCEGPGSMLGIRTTAMAIRTWQTLRPRPAYRYQSLPLLACELLRAGSPQPFSVIADARRDSWHCVTVTNGAAAPLRRVPAAELASGTGHLHQPAAFRAWAQAPRPAADSAYDAAKLLAAHAGADIFSETAAPDAFQHEAPEYRKWSAEVHSAATVRPAQP